MKRGTKVLRDKRLAFSDHFDHRMLSEQADCRMWRILTSVFRQKDTRNLPNITFGPTFFSVVRVSSPSQIHKFRNILDEFIIITLLTATLKHFQNVAKQQITLLLIHDFCDFGQVETRQNGALYWIPDTDWVFSKMQKNQFALLSEEIDKKFCVFWSICIGDWAKKIQNLDGTFVVDFCGGGSDSLPGPKSHGI